MQRPLFMSLLIFISGITVPFFIKLNFDISLYSYVNLLIILGFFCLLFVWLIYFYKKEIKLSLYFTFVFILGLALGFMRLDAMDRDVQYIDGEQIERDLLVYSVSHGENRINLLVDDEAGNRLQLQIFDKNDKVNILSQKNYNHGVEANIDRNISNLDFWQPGQILKVKGQYKAPAIKRNPGAFDEKYYYWLNNWQGKIYSYPDQVKIVGENSSLKYKFANKLFLSKLSYQKLLLIKMEAREYSIINALVLGDRASMDYDTKELIRKLGLSHLFAISGLHVGIIVLIFYYILDYFNITRERTYIILICFLPLYAFLVGGSPSVVRAVVMAELVLLASLFRKNSDILTNLMLSAFILLLYNPKLLGQVGFQLTFLVTYGIIIFTPYIDYFLKKSRISWPSFRNIMAMTLSAQIFAFPLLVYHFSEFAWPVLFSQFAVLQLMSIFILPIGVFFILTAWIHPLLSVFPIEILKYASRTLLFMADKMEFASKYISLFADISWIWLILYFASIFSLIYLLYFRYYSRHFIIINLSIIFIIVLSLWMPALPSDSLEVTMIDVGQGDSMHIRTPEGYNILIDGGGQAAFLDYRYDVGERILVPYLQAKGVKKLDLVILSHDHLDHIDGLQTVLEKIPVGLFLYALADMNNDDFLRLYRTGIDKNIKMQQLSKGDTIKISDDILLRVVHPDLSDKVFLKGQSVNNNSLTISLEYKEHKLLFTGDIEAEAEQYMLNEPAIRDLTLLKVAHHGSKTSSTEKFIEVANPQISVIGVGKNNFGHPHPDVMLRLEDKSDYIFRTDLHGAINLKIKNQDIKIKTMLLGN